MHNHPDFGDDNLDNLIIKKISRTISFVAYSNATTKPRIFWYFDDARFEQLAISFLPLFSQAPRYYNRGELQNESASGQRNLSMFSCQNPLLETTKVGRVSRPVQDSSRCKFCFASQTEINRVPFCQQPQTYVPVTCT